MTKIWQPSATREVLETRAKILVQIRDFFCSKKILEVETPVLSHSTVTDVHLSTFKTNFKGPDPAIEKTIYLVTSPESHMKRLLASGSGSIYQICKSFRNGEYGRYHNPEFTMLEWYRVGFDHHNLMDEVQELLTIIFDIEAVIRVTYQQAFHSCVGICPLDASLADLKEVCEKLGFGGVARNENDRDTLLQLLFSMKVEKEIHPKNPVFVYNFPASQAALAKISRDDPRVSERFELYFRGIELANGFHELNDASEQKARFQSDNQKRLELGLKKQPLDEELLNALAGNFPACAGVALGLDRLIMLASTQEKIKNVITFDFSRA